MPTSEPSSPQPNTSRSRLTQTLFGDVITQAVADATASISLCVAEDPGWHLLIPQGPHDRDHSEWL